MKIPAVRACPSGHRQPESSVNDPMQRGGPHTVQGLSFFDFRVVCFCGWKGPWAPTEEAAICLWERRVGEDS